MNWFFGSDKNKRPDLDPDNELVYSSIEPPKISSRIGINFIAMKNGTITKINSISDNIKNSVTTTITNTCNCVYLNLINRDEINDKYLLNRSNKLNIPPDAVSAIDYNRRLSKTIKYSSYGIMALSLFFIHKNTKTSSKILNDIKNIPNIYQSTGNGWFPVKQLSSI